MKYYKKFNSIDKFNDWYLKNNYVEPNIIVIKEYNDHGEEISTTVDYNNEMLTLVYDTSLDEGTRPLWTTYNGEIYDMIYIDNQLVKNTMDPILSSNLSKGKHIVKIKFKNKNAIGNNAPIIYNPYLIKANIPNSVTTITANAFNGCSSLTDINIPDSVTTIGSSAFIGCYNLESVIIGNSVTTIGSSAFNGCQLKKITFGKGLIQLNSVSNYGINTSSLEECNILSNITELPGGMFNNCNNLIKVTLPNSLITIGTCAFYYCSSLTSINIPDSVTSIGSSAFSSCYRLTSITIPNSVTSIGDNAFSNSGLIELNIPDSVTNIGGGAFSGCQLKKITFGKGLTQLNSLYGTSSSSLEECNILSNITELPDGMFSNYNKLTKVTLPNSLTTIASGLFYYCSSLTSITIPNSVISIGSSAFYYCSSLTSIIIPDSVTSIGYNVFNGCTKLFYTVDNIYYFDVNNNFGSFMTGILDTTQTSYTIKEGTTRIDADIPNLPNAVSFTLPSTLEEIKDYSLDNVATILTQEQLEYALDININCISINVKHQLFGYVENGIKYYYDDTTEKLELLEFIDTTLTSYTIKNGVNVINISIPQLPNAQSITIPNTITSLANNSFDNIANILTKQQIESLLAINNKSISYNKLLEYYYTKEQLSNEYFTVYNSSNSYLYLYWYQKGSGEETDVMQYSSDNGVTWNTMPDYNTDKSYISISPNNKRIFKSTLTPSSDGIGRFECSSWGSDKNCFATGNIMSLLYGDNFKNQTSLSDKQYVFKELFYNNSYIKNAKYLILPATTLANYCYEGMFKNCTSLTTAPQLPAITLADYCYYYMFYGCTNLTTAPELPATTLANSCYERMFANCTSLITAPELPVTTLTSSCYSSMFVRCTSLATAPELPATTLPDRCYSNMFTYCTSLTSAPELPAITLAEACYYQMFYGCTNLTSAPVLPATTLSNYCYESMFQGCTSLITAPELPATTLATTCYQWMFKDCTSLTTAPELPATTLATYCYESMFQGCTNLTTAPELPATTLAIYCYRDMFEKCTSLTTAPELPATKLAESCYEYMFYGCTSLTTVPELPATTLVERCYQYMFQNCTSLTTAPELPATTLAKQCYMGMFYGCTSLTTAPILPATTLSDFCYDIMFYGCTSLNNITMLATNISATSCLWNWVSNVATTGTFYKAASMTKLPTGVNGVPSGWNIQEYEIRPEPRELPEGYTEVKYIASTKTGGQYIDLNILLYDVLNKNYDIAMKFNLIGNGSDNDDQPTIFGCQDNTADPWPGTFIRRSASNVVGRYIGGSNKDNTLGQLGNIIELTEKTSPSKNVYNYNNSGKVHSWGTSLFCAFADANGTPMRQCEAKIYYFKLFVEGTLVRDLVPCINSSNVAGFYDVVNDTFYTSLSNTPFIYEAYLS